LGVEDGIMFVWVDEVMKRSSLAELRALSALKSDAFTNLFEESVVIEYYTFF